MEIKAKDMCPRCKHCLGMTPQGMYSCGKAYDGSELNVGINVVLNCANFEWKDEKVEGKASDICPNCKYCEGMVEDSFYICGVTHSDGGLYHLMPAEDELYCTAYEEEINMSNLKVEGKAGDLCPKCKNCKGTTNEYDGNDFVVITGVKCEDPYDGMTKTLTADSDICCSMFEMKSEKSCDKISLLQHELEMDKLRRKIHELEKEKTAHMKGIERLKKRAADSDYYKEESELLEERNNNQFDTIREKNKEIGELGEKLKKANELADSWKRDYERLRDQFVHPIYNILYPDNPNLDINVTDLLNYVKDLKVYAGENKSMYEDLKYWKERCHKAETDVTTLNSKVEVLKNKNDKYLKKIIDQQARDYKQCSRIMELEFAVNKLQSGEYDDILAKDIEIKSLQAKYEDVMSGWNHTMESHDRLKDEIDKLKNENASLNTINKGLAEDRKKLINYIRSLKIASENYLKEFTYEED